MATCAATGEPPYTTWRRLPSSVAAKSGCSQTICRIVGTAGEGGDAVARDARQQPAGVEAGGTTTVPPLNRVGRVTWLSPAVWNSGATASATSVLSTSTCASWLSRLKVTLPCEITAPLGRPVVPDV